MSDVEVLKSDAFGRVERFRAQGQARVRRVACGSRIPGSGVLARVLLAREARCLERLAGLPGLPGDAVRRGRQILEREWLAGDPLWAARSLPSDYFERLEELVCALHERGVCHNDLHKENNVLVGEDGFPRLIDFQLGSVHRPGSRSHRARAAEDVRHVRKHRARYEARGVGGRSLSGGQRGLVARVWRRTGKPLYNWLTRRVLKRRDGEPKRPKQGPWPEWGPAVGAWPGGVPSARDAS